MNDAMKPSQALLAKLASIITHHEEFLVTAHPFDLDAAKALRESHDVKEWMMDMQRLGLTPVKRHG
jgi:hypothetical protein